MKQEETNLIVAKFMDLLGPRKITLNSCFRIYVNCQVQAEAARLHVQFGWRCATSVNQFYDRPPNPPGVAKPI